MTDSPNLPRRKYRRPENDVDTKLPLRNVLNIIFIALVVIAIVFYFAMPQNRYIFIILSIVAVIIKSVEVGIRISVNNKRRK